MFNKMTLCTVSIVVRLGACAKYGCLKLQIFVKIKDS